MELSGNAKRAMEMVERNLNILYGADYFTEEEWIKVDCLLHKGRYVLSDGPPSNILEEPLMTFEENKDDEKDMVQVQEQEFFSQTKAASIVDTEETVSSPSERGNSPPFPETASETPVETPGEESYPQRTSTDELAPLPAPSNTVGEQRATIDQQLDHLPPGCTQAQLDEVRAFNAGLTKAGDKSRPKYEPVKEDPYDDDQWNADYNEPSTDEQVYASPPSTEREKRIDTWADGIAKLPRSPQPPQIESPIPNCAPPTAPAVEILAQKFIETHGRQPKSLNDFYQPNNLAHNPRRPGSQASMRTTKTAASIKTSTHPNSGIVPGKSYTAQSGAPSKGIRFEVWPGDHIKVTKFVSGIMYIGENLRSGKCGQFPETIFKKDPNASQPSAMGARAPASFQRGLDQVENANAAEWDDVPVPSIRPPGTTAPTSHPSLGRGLAASRFSSTAEGTAAVQGMQSQQGGMTDMAGQIGKIINDTVEEILKSRGVGPEPQPQATQPRTIQPRTAQALSTSNVQPVQPKTETCWFWSVKNDCRFTAEECRDLHAFVPNRPGEATNLRQGKPTWGALADSLPSPSSNAQSNLGVIGDGLKAKTKMCYYWAVIKSCSNTAENCKYLHEYSPLGIAPRPNWSKPSGTWKREWRDHHYHHDQEGSEAEREGHDGDLVLEEVGQADQVELDGWGQPIIRPSESARDKYRPPHVKALEDQVSQATGW